MILSNKSNLTKNLNKSNRIKASIMGFVVGDALGVPVEFQSRNILKRKKVKDMEEYGTHNQPKGTWSDDTSMVLATMDAIVNTPIDDMNTYTMFKNILDAFLNWKINSKYTPFNNVFDIGNSTNYSLTNYKNKKEKYNENIINDSKLEELINCGYDDISSNGNGSLMRILPLAIYGNMLILDDNLFKNFIYTGSSLTHSHIYSKIGCFIYSKYIEYLLDGINPKDAYILLKKWFNNCDVLKGDKEITLNIYKRILVDDISNLGEKEIKSSGYIVDTLEAVMWTILTTNNYKDALLKAVNLGDDTDTIGALTGGLAGLIYGFDEIPQEWLKVIQKKDYVSELINKFINKLNDYDKYLYEEDEIATRKSWKILDMPNETKKIKLDLKLTKENLTKLKKEHIPKEMEDHWFAFYENNKFYIYRSWTGICLYIVDIQEDGTILSAIVNRNIEQYNNTNDLDDIKSIKHLIYWYAGERKKSIQILNEK